MKSIIFILTLFFPVLSYAVETRSHNVIDVFLQNNIINRDSGSDVTREFLEHCLRRGMQSDYILECDDVLFPYYISFFEHDDKNSYIIFITQHGASLENRWVFEIQDAQYIDITEKAWPILTEKMISDLMILKTGNEQYSERYLFSSAHSIYRLLHTHSNTLIVYSGIPDESYGTELGYIEWNGHEFNFFH